MKTGRGVAMILALGLVLCAAWACNKAADTAKAAAGTTEAVDDVAVVINDTTISKAEYEREVARVQKQLMAMGQNLQGTQLAEFKQKTLDNLIERTLLEQEAKREGFAPDMAEVEKQFTELKARLGTPEQFKKALDSMNLTEEQGKAQLARDLVLQKLVKKIVEAAPAPEEAKVKEFYEAHKDQFGTPEQVQASHILVKVDQGADQATKDAAKKKITDIQGKLKKGGDFAELAKANSDCPSKAQGGDLGFFGRGQMAKPFEDAAFALEKGKMSGIVETQFGYHVIKLTDKKAAQVANFDESKVKIVEQLKQEGMRDTLRQTLDKLRQAAKIDIRIKDLATPPAAPAAPAEGQPAPANP